MLILLFASLLAVAFASQSCLHPLFFTRLQVVGVTLDFLDDVLLLNLAFEAAQRIFQRLAFLYTNFSQRISTSKPASGPILIILEIVCLCSVWLDTVGQAEAFEDGFR